MIKLKPCPKCGGKNIKINNPKYSSFNAGDVMCLKCGFEVNVRYMENDVDFAATWNKKITEKIKAEKLKKRQELEREYCKSLSNAQLEELNAEKRKCWHGCNQRFFVWAWDNSDVIVFDEDHKTAIDKDGHKLTIKSVTKKVVGNEWVELVEKGVEGG